MQEIPNVLATDMEAKPYPPYHHRPEGFGGYFFKTYAIYQSTFDQVTPIPDCVPILASIWQRMQTAGNDV